MHTELSEEHRDTVEMAVRQGRCVNGCYDAGDRIIDFVFQVSLGRGKQVAADKSWGIK
jgi:hypothetical protein